MSRHRKLHSHCSSDENSKGTKKNQQKTFHTQKLKNEEETGGGGKEEYRKQQQRIPHPTLYYRTNHSATTVFFSLSLSRFFLTPSLTVAAQENKESIFWGERESKREIGEQKAERKQILKSLAKQSIPTFTTRKRGRHHTNLCAFNATLCCLARSALRFSSLPPLLPPPLIIAPSSQLFPCFASLAHPPSSTPPTGLSHVGWYQRVAWSRGDRINVHDRCREVS